MTTTAGGRQRLARRAGRERPVAPGLVLVAAMLGFFMMSLDATAVNVALPGIGRALGGTTAGLQWVVDGYTLMLAALLISAGAISDRAGANRVFATGLAAFIAASAACGVAPAIQVLIAARVIQGSAAAVMLPASLALVRQAFPDPAKRVQAVALWTAGGAVAIAAGPVMGGVLTTAVSWRAIFFINLPVGVATLAVLARVPASARRSVRLDLAGQVTASVALAALTAGVIEGGGRGFGAPVPLACLLLSAAAATAFLIAEARAACPMVPLRLFQSRIVTVCVVIGFAVNGAYYGVAFVLSLYFQRVLGQSAAGTGVLFLPMTALLSAANLVSVRASRRAGPRLPIIAGQLGSALGLVALTFATAGTDRLVAAAALIPVGVGLGFALPSLTVMLLDAIPAEQAGLAAGLLNSSRQAGGTLAVAAFGALIANRASFASGMRVSMLAAAVLLLITTAAALALPRRPPR
jgi:DHA2 family methylenomycin A resistance protein-like MFS transporter